MPSALNGSATVLAMSTASVLIPAEETHRASNTPRYTLLLSTDPALIDAAQRLRHDVFTTEPGFALAGASDGRDADRFDEFCDHLLVREDNTGELVGCYRMLPPPGAIAAGGLYTATEFDVTGLDPLRPSLVEMGRAVVRDDHRNGGVVLLMWAGILAYLDRCGYDYVTGCVSVPVEDSRRCPGAPDPRCQGLRAAQARRPSEYTVHPYRPVTLDGRGLDDIEPPGTGDRPAADARLSAPRCRRCAANPPTTPTSGSATSLRCSTSARPTSRYLTAAAVGRRGERHGRRDRVVSSRRAGRQRDRRQPMAAAGDVRRQLCGSRRRARRQSGRGGGAGRGSGHAARSFCSRPLPLLAMPMPGQSHVQRSYCRMMLRCLGVRITVSGGPIRNLRGVLVVSGHVSWVDIFSIGAVHARLVRRQGRAGRLARPRYRSPA